MEIIVAMKQVPDVGSGIRLNDEGTDLARDEMEFVTSPFDEVALEQALLLKEVEGGDVTVVALDDPGIDQALYRAIALGADRAVKLVGTGGGWVDSHRRAGLVAGWISGEGAIFDLILSGVQGPDDLDGQVPALIAAGLGLPFASVVVDVEASEDAVRVTQEFGGGRIGRLDLPLPAVLGVQSSLRDPRYVSEMRIRLAAMGGGIEEVPMKTPGDGAGLSIRRVFPPEAARNATMLPADPAEAAEAILNLLGDRGLLR